MGRLQAEEMIRLLSHMGVNIHHRENVLHRCSNCGIQELVLMQYDMGSWFYLDEDDTICNNCSEDGTYVMDIVEEEDNG